jgi:hypothetical protein
MAPVRNSSSCCIASQVSEESCLVARRRRRTLLLFATSAYRCFTAASNVFHFPDAVLNTSVAGCANHLELEHFKISLEEHRRLHMGYMRFEPTKKDYTKLDGISPIWRLDPLS